MLWRTPSIIFWETPNYEKGECLLFVDGLRFDLAKRLEMKLEEERYHIESKFKWAPLPTVTSTGKPAMTPVRNKIYGSEINNDFEPFSICALQKFCENG